MWDAFNQALSVAGAHRAGRCTFTLLDTEAEAGASMLVELPSGRFLHYRSIWTEESTTRWGAPCTDYWYADGFEYSTEQRKGKRGPKSRLCPDNRWRDRVNQTAVIENVVQATARDIFVHQMLEMATGERLRPAFHVHDEAVCACRPCTCDLSEWQEPSKHASGCAWASAARELIATMSRVPETLPHLADVPVAAELSKGVWRTYAG
jgi:hypothetical protein